MVNEYATLVSDVYGQMQDLYSRYKGREGYSVIGLGLAEEAGEVLGELYKWLYLDDYDQPAPDRERQQKIKEEMGDLLWYFTALCVKLGTDIEELSLINQVKLEKRRSNRG